VSPRRLLPIALLSLAGCGGGGSSAPRGLALTATGRFPAAQRVAGPAQLRVDVRDDDDRSAPDVAVTIDSFAAGWIVDHGPGGGTAANPQTWSTGPLAPGGERTFTWAVTPVRAGTYTVGWRVSAGAGTSVAGGRPSSGSFTVIIRSTPADTRVDPRTGRVVARPRPIGAGAAG
jgi:hypothetical protein